MTNQTAIKETQYAVQLVGPSELVLNTNKEVFKPGPTQVLAEVECVGLCFSDLKLLKQFTGHVRKSEIVGGLTAGELAQMPCYVPGQAPTVPGHEAVCRIVAVGDQVTRHQVGERVLVQTDYRALKTANSNAAFGYNFEGALQEYALMDERVIIEKASGERFLIPASEDLSASSIALVEPWACVEDSYVTAERQTIKAGGKLLVVVDSGRRIVGLTESFAPEGAPAEITVIGADAQALKELGTKVTKATSAADLADFSLDDIVYYGCDKATVEALCDKLAGKGILNIVTNGATFGQDVSFDVGRVHYGMIRLVGTTGDNAAVSYRHIPATGEVRDNDRILVVGAGGPMGQMHVIRNVSTQFDNLSLIATDFDSERLDSLYSKAKPVADKNGVDLKMVNPQNQTVEGRFSYIALMAPVAPLVAKAVKDSADGALINIFAGIPAGTRQDLDLDAYIANRCWMFGTSGSTIDDMKQVLAKVTDGQLNTDCSVDAISGMAGAIDGIAAVENRALAGKIMVYPALKETGLIPLTELEKHFPTVAAKLTNGLWTKAAEDELLKVAN